MSSRADSPGLGHGLAATPSGEGTRTRTREFIVHPDTIKRLPTGTAAVTSPGHTEARITRIHHPKDAR